MINKEKLASVMTAYRNNFNLKRAELNNKSHWEDEQYKWIAVQWFQDHWNIEATDFGAMFKEATAKHFNLLTAQNYFPRGMILEFAAVDPEAVRQMFRDLYDESKPLVDRVNSFIEGSERLRVSYGNEKWKHHYQRVNSVSTYLWSRFPDKYYIYKYSDCKEVSAVLESGYTIKKGAKADILIDCIRLYDEIAEFLMEDIKTKEMVAKALTSECYPDPKYKILALDVGYYISHRLFKNTEKELTSSDIVISPHGKDSERAGHEWLKASPNGQEGSAMRDAIEKLMRGYATARNEVFANNPFGEFVRKDIPEMFYEQGSIDKDRYLITGSVGQGNWAMIPWICIFDRAITTSATKGVYVVYLLSKDCSRLYLTFNQGCTDIRKTHDRKETISIMREKADKLSVQIDNRGFASDEDISLGEGLTELGILYQKGTIFYKKYDVDSIPDEQELKDDLSKMMDIYKDYVQLTKSIDITAVIPPKKVESKMDITVKEAIDQIKSYIAGKGFTYGDGLIENFYLSLKSKPFVILAGTSGTGKTRLVKLFAEAIGAVYKMVSVRPDWSDGSDLFGHWDLNGNYIRGPICDAFDAAIADPTRPVLLCLDEMNLARVEYYLSDFLSVIESRERDSDGKVTTDPIAQYEDGIPDNLYIVGTVNMDETTFPFSKKVLDRANTIEFSYVELEPEFDAYDPDIEPLQLPNRFLRTEYLVLAADCAGEKEYVIQVCDELQKINSILRKANAHVGYRVRDEIVFYMLNNKTAGNLLTDLQAFDNEIMQKILPRIQGSGVAIKDLLTELFKYCMSDNSELDTENGNVGKQMQSMADNATYPESAKKIAYMMTRYEEDGFTSYWL